LFYHWLYHGSAREIPPSFSKTSEIGN